MSNRNNKQEPYLKNVETGNGWHEKMVNVLWVYRTTIKTPTNTTSSKIANGTEVVFYFQV